MSGLQTFRLDDVEPLDFIAPGLVRGTVVIGAAKPIDPDGDVPEVVRITVIAQLPTPRSGQGDDRRLPGFQDVLEALKAAALVRLEFAAEILRKGTAADLIAGSQPVGLSPPARAKGD